MREEVFASAAAAVQSLRSVSAWTAAWLTISYLVIQSPGRITGWPGGSARPVQVEMPATGMTTSAAVSHRRAASARPTEAIARAASGIAAAIIGMRYRPST